VTGIKSPIPSRKQVHNGRTFEATVGAPLFETLSRRAEQDEDGGGRADLPEYLDFADAFKLVNSNKMLLDPDLRKAISENGSMFDRLAPIRNRVMHSRPLQFDDATHVTEAVRKLLGAVKRSFPNLAEMQENLQKNPDFALSLEIRSSSESPGGVTNNLPIPDFDETGFLGRKDEVKALIRALKGPFPVITVLGEGGVGKTALALQAAYDLVDDNHQPFQAIVWVSSKTTRLTVNDIQKIEGSIETSLGVFREAQKNLSGQADDNALEEVLEYLNTFKVLLVLDNLETVLDQTVRNFLYGITGSSKILITSRVGVGELDFSFRLSGMSRDDAQQLLRATATGRRVRILAQATKAQLSDYCMRMRDNPAFIKWFVTAVQCDKRPDEVLARPALFLDFCLSNVYTYLNLDAIKIANALLSLPGRHPQPVISYLAELDGDRFQKALRQLVTTNMVSMSPAQSNSGRESQYELSDLPRSYIAKNHPVSKEEVSLFQKRKREIVSTHERLSATARNDRYTVMSMVMRTPDDAVAATYLVDALKQVKSQEFSDAFGLIDRAKALAPSYFEVYRVEGWAQTFAGNIPAARDAYMTALELEQNSAPLLLWYGGYLLRYADDAEGANQQFEEAAKLDPASPEIQAELGRTRMYLRKFENADVCFERAFVSPSATLKLRRISYDGWLQSSVRKAEQEYERGEYISTYECIGAAIVKFNDIPKDALDSRMTETIAKCAPLIQRVERQLALSDHLPLVSKTREDLNRALDQGVGAGTEDRLRGWGLQVDKGDLADGEVYTGYIDRLVSQGKYGFIKTPHANDIFFHQSELPLGTTFGTLKIGQEVRFVARFDESQGRMLAKDIAVISGRSAADAPATLFGTVKQYGYNGQNFGFIAADDGQEYFFHRKNIRDQREVVRFRDDVSVCFLLGNNEKGIMADLVWLVEPETLAITDMGS
jgi:LuxR family transcriptional regulator, glucitol operon activator